LSNIPVNFSESSRRGRILITSDIHPRVPDQVSGEQQWSITETICPPCRHNPRRRF